MQKRIWCNLPDVLLERILAMLPVASLLRFRCVCKAWSSLIVSSDFVRLCTNSAHENNACILLSTWDKLYPLLAFNPTFERWHVPSLDLLQDDYSLVAGDGGLLCLSDGICFILCNPLTKASRKVSWEPKGQQLTNIVLTSFRTYEVTRGFQLLVVGSTDRCGQATYFYDSVEQSWTLGSGHHELFFFESNGVFHGQSFVITTSFPRKLMTFNTTTATWSEHAASLPDNVQNPYLVECYGGKLILAAAVQEHCSDEPLEAKLNTFQLWELNEQSLTWKEFASMPDFLFRQILERRDHFEGFSCVSGGNLIYLASSEGFIVFDITLKSWRWLPESPVLSGLQACVRDLFALVPSLDGLL